MSLVAAGVNLGYSLTWIIGYLASRPDLQQNGFQAIREVYDGETPKPHEFDRVAYVKALHTVSDTIYILLGLPSLTPGLNRRVHACSHQFVLGFPARLLKVPVIWATRSLKTWYVHCQAKDSILEGRLISPAQLVIMNLFAGNRDSKAFDRPDEFLPERWLYGRKGRTDLLGGGGDKIGVPHLTYGAGRRVCPGIDSKSCFLDSMCAVFV